MPDAQHINDAGAASSSAGRCDGPPFAAGDSMSAPSDSISHAGAAADATASAAALMAGFAERTGLTSSRPAQRYLWTDAFAVCNFLGLARASGNPRHQGLALELVDRVHHTLGRHRAGGTPGGWLSGLSGGEAEAHPTRGGLRIGKPLAERAPNEPYDPELEWERDGQYFHYLTQWMHALDQACRASRRPRLNRWARELAEAAHRGFVHGTGARRRMYWKMSVDLSRPLVTSMGQHDALDGYVQCVELRATAAWLGERGSSLDEEARSFGAMIDASELATADPLGLGALLVAADRLDQLTEDAQLRDGVVRAALVGLEHWVRQRELRQPAAYRLAFRELGLAIGVAAATALRGRGQLDGTLGDELRRYEPLRREILAFWLAPEHRRVPTFVEHQDINEVMLATALLPDGFLTLT
jgi:hypothetical protein